MKTWKDIAKDKREIDAATVRCPSKEGRASVIKRTQSVRDRKASEQSSLSVCACASAHRIAGIEMSAKDILEADSCKIISVNLYSSTVLGGTCLATNEKVYLPCFIVRQTYFLSS